MHRRHEERGRALGRKAARTLWAASTWMLVLGCSADDFEFAEYEYEEVPGYCEGQESVDAGVGLAHFPLADGATWTYVHESPSAASWTETKELVYDGCAFRLDTLDEREGARQMAWLGVEGGAVYRWAQHERIPGGTTLVVGYEPGFLRFDDAWLNATAGEAIEHVHERTERVDDDVEQAARVYEFEVLSMSESIEVPAGTFDDCMVVRRTRRSNGDAVVAWFAPGVGKVREENPENLDVEELAEFTIPN